MTIETSKTYGLTGQELTDLASRLAALSASDKTTKLDADPTTSTEGEIGDLAINTATGEIFYLKEIQEESGETPTYIWQTFTQDGGIKTLTTADYNYPTSNPTYVALWKLDSGMYVAGETVSVARTANITGALELGDGVAVMKCGDYRTIVSSGHGAYASLPIYVVTNSGTALTRTAWSQAVSVALRDIDVYDALNESSAHRPLSANQGRVLNEKIGGDLTNLNTTDKTSLISAINEVQAATQGTVEYIDLTPTSMDTTNLAVTASTSETASNVATLLTNGTNVYYRLTLSSAVGAIAAGIYLMKAFLKADNSGVSLIQGAGIGLLGGSTLSVFSVSHETGNPSVATVRVHSLLESGDLTIAQTTGTSTTAVMSQDAITSLISALDTRITALENSSLSLIMTTTDNGENVAQAANTLKGVYNA